MLMRLLLPLLPLFYAVHAAPIAMDAPDQNVRKVVAVESVIVGSDGKPFKVIRDVVDIDLLASVNNNVTAALAITRARLDSAGANVPAVVDVAQIAGLKAGDFGPSFEKAFQVAKQNGLRHFVELISAAGGKASDVKRLSEQLPFSKYTEVDKSLSSPSKPSSVDSVDYLYIGKAIANKLDGILSIYDNLSSRAAIHIAGCSPGSTECQSVVALLKAAKWSLVGESKGLEDIILSRLDPADKRQLLDQILDGVFEGLMKPSDLRYRTMKRAAELAAVRGAKVLVETGTARNGMANCAGDGCSTIIFGRLVERLAAISPPAAPLLYTVDILPQAIAEARAAASKVSSRVSYHATDSLKFLDSFAQPIDLLYLDSYDFSAANPQPSQQHHLKELLIAWDKLHDKSVIIVDDCGLANMGKCKLVDEHLAYAGWKLDTEGYQRVYVKN